MTILAGRHALRLVPQKTGHSLTASGGSEWSAVNGGSLQTATHTAQIAKTPRASIFSQHHNSLNFMTFIIPFCGSEWRGTA